MLTLLMGLAVGGGAIPWLSRLPANACGAFALTRGTDAPIVRAAVSGFGKNGLPSAARCSDAGGGTGGVRGGGTSKGFVDTRVGNGTSSPAKLYDVPCPFNLCPANSPVELEALASTQLRGVFGAVCAPRSLDETRTLPSKFRGVFGAV